MSYSHKDFSMSVRWLEPDKGSYPRPSNPGFYLQLGKANEGEAEWIANQELLSGAELEALICAVGDVLARDLGSYAQSLRSQTENHRAGYIKSLQTQRDRLNERLAAIGIASGS